MQPILSFHKLPSTLPQHDWYSIRVYASVCIVGAMATFPIVKHSRLLLFFVIFICFIKRIIAFGIAIE